MPSESLDPKLPVFTAADLVEYQRARGRLPGVQPPQTVILSFQDHLTKHVTRRYSGSKVRIFNADLYLLRHANDRLGVISGFGAGSATTAALVDQLAAFGVGCFLSIGLAGGLQPDHRPGQLVVSERSICDEGVSRHYLPAAEVVESSAEMAHKMRETLGRRGHACSSGTTWTTDAPFREIRKDVLTHQKEGVLAVDMEAAALFAVAKANGLPALAVFSIADTLAHGVWNMSPDQRPALNGLTTLFDAAYEYLSG
jgi:uridine phosphorylase